jgi:hypothetical protein
MGLNDDIDSEDAADLKLGNDADAITRRLTRIVHKLTVANTRLSAIKVALPPGPPCTPEQALALSSILGQTTQLTATVNAIFLSNPPVGGIPGPQ